MPTHSRYGNLTSLRIRVFSWDYMNRSPADLQLETLDEEAPYTAPETRIKNARAGRDIFFRLLAADEKRALMRTRHQALLDGEPPYDQSVLMATGQGSRTNVNWGDAQAIMASVEAGLIDMNVSVERLMRIPLIKEAVPDDETRFNLENIAADEFTRAIRNWEDFDRSYLNLGRTCFAHGVGIAYFDDDRCWQFETTGLGDFVIPNGTKASENRIVVAGCRRHMEVHELYGKIRNEKIAEKLGWNVETVKRAILQAQPEHSGQGWSGSGWMKVQEEMRNNDIGASLSGKTATVGVIHLLQQEFDGTVSKYIVAEQPIPGYSQEQEEPWLYKRPSIYEEMRRGVIVFTYSIGEHGTYHSISGMLRRIYPQGTAINRALSTMLDAAIVGAGIVMQPETESSISRMKLVTMGGAMTLLPAAEHGQMITRTMPDLAGGLMPLVADLRNTIGRRAGQFQGDSPFQQSQEKTRFQVAAELEALGKVGATQINLWYQPWSRLLREVVRRMCRPDYPASAPGGKEVEILRNRLKSRGFPIELMQAIDYDGIVADRAIGAGSGAARTAALAQMDELAGEFDEIGRYNWIRDKTAAALNGNYDLASRYKPPIEKQRVPFDTQLANLENNDMMLGQEPKLEGNQLHMAHLDAHIPFLVGMVESIERGEAQMSELVEPMVICHAHATEHLEMVQDARTIESRVAQYRQLLQQLGEVVGNAMRQQIAEQQKAMEEQGEGAEQGGPSPALQEKMIAARLKLEGMASQASLKMALEEQKHQQKMGHMDEKFRREAAQSDAKTAAQMISDARRAAQQRSESAALADIKRKTAAATKGPPKPKKK
jgi:hypothetical protein